MEVHVPLTHALTVQIPEDLLDRLDGMVASGEYESVSAAVIDALGNLADAVSPTDDWMRREVLPVFDECERDPSRLIPADEVFARIEERYRREVEARGRAA